MFGRKKVRSPEEIWNKTPYRERDWNKMPVQAKVDIQHVPKGWQVNVFAYAQGPHGVLTNEIRTPEFLATYEEACEWANDWAERLGKQLRERAILAADSRVFEIEV